MLQTNWPCVFCDIINSSKNYNSICFNVYYVLFETQQHLWGGLTSNTSINELFLLKKTESKVNQPSVMLFPMNTILFPVISSCIMEVFSSLKRSRFAQSCAKIEEVIHVIIKSKMSFFMLGKYKIKQHITFVLV